MNEMSCEILAHEKEKKPIFREKLSDVGSFGPFNTTRGVSASSF